MKQTKTAAAVIAGALFAGAWFFGADQRGGSADVQLEAAIHTEMVDGNFKAAIEQHKKTAQTGDRAVAAQALVRMAEVTRNSGMRSRRRSTNGCCGTMRTRRVRSRSRVRSWGATPAAQSW